MINIRQKTTNMSRIILLIFYLIAAFFFAISALMMRDMEYNSWIKAFAVLCALQFFMQYIFLKCFKVKLFSLTGLFVVLTYLFHFGQVVLMGIFNISEYQRRNMYLSLNPQDVQATSTFCLICVLTVVFGVLISCKKDSEADEGSGTNMNITKSVGWILVVFFFPIKLYLDITNLSVSIDAGYLATYQTGIAGIWGALSYFSFTGFALLLMSYKDEKRKAAAVYYFILVYCVINMFSGDRGKWIIIITLLTYLYHNVVKKINGRRFLALCIIGFFVLVFMNTVAVFRSVQGKTVSEFMEEYRVQMTEKNPVVDFVAELGTTIRTPILVYQQVPSITPYAYGSTYPLGVFSVFPDVGDAFEELNKKAYYDKNIMGNALGGSYIGELYYNFSWFGIFFAIFVGLFVNKVSRKIELSLKNEHYLRIGYYVPLFIYMLWWTRDAFYSIVRPTVWGALVLYVISCEVKNRYKETNAEVFVK